MHNHGARRFGTGVFALALAALSFAACSSEEAGAVDVVGGPGCANGIKDGDEVGVDCGGSCAKCAGDPCADVVDCKSGNCVDGRCAAPPDKPCGVGVASGLCELGAPCETGNDCKTKTCTDGKCATPPPGPNSGVKDNGETDVDCGGPNAPACAAGKTCLRDEDCTDKYCPEANPRVCVTPRNDDGVKNGTETDVDCGGTSGNKCAVGKACVADGDCTVACNYAKKCVEAPSCKPQFGGDTCGAGNYEDAGKKHESCCKSLPVPGYTAPNQPGKQVYLDKYEVTAGRIRAFIDDIAAKNNGVPNVKAWLQANKPPVWSSSFDFILPSGETEKIGESMPHYTLPNGVPPTNNVGTFYIFGSARYVYVHGENCYQGNNSYGYSTFWYPPNVMATHNGGVARGVPRADEAPFAPLAVGAKEQLDMKSITCIPSAVLAAFCHWDGGQLATDEVLDFVTNAPASLGSAAGCGSRCAPITQVQATSDSGSDNGILYRYPFYNETSEGVYRIASPGRVTTDVVRINAGDEPWMDLHGNVHETVFDMSGPTFRNEFMIKYRGIGYSSARAIQNRTAMKYPEYKAAYSGGRCMRFK